MAGNSGSSGAWKVAYADFVTAMMALFMVLWISAQDHQILISTARYFQAPTKPLLNAAAGVMPMEKFRPETGKSSGEKDNPGTGLTDQKAVDLEYLNKLARELYRLLNLDESRTDNPIDIQVTSDGLRVILYDRNGRPLFVDRGTELTEWGRFVMDNLAWLIDRDHFYVTIEGHTRAGLTLDDRPSSYTLWELSADRANASRRALTEHVVSPALIERVVGYADTRPLLDTDATSESNQRVTLSLRLPRKHTPKP
ncbi:flagellar motor protein MotB [Geminisphaera colitermitum]|uniref:flagellar motor protein MotB n=1 Tax=Geminisphaera colitermitum TaxID=1148786 RepID=UPI000158C55A|nr:flagellar motor protein MotB [Geminisphaera colitermitum]